MQTLIVILIAKPGNEALIENSLRSLLDATTNEPGAISYELHRGPTGSRRFVLYERYDNSAALRAHLGADYVKAAMSSLAGLLEQPPEIQECEHIAGMHPRRTLVDGKPLACHVIPLGPANLVFAQTERGILACGAIDPAALQRFGLPTARVKPTRGASIANLEDLLSGEVRDANDAAAAMGVRTGISGREAIALMQLK